MKRFMVHTKVQQNQLNMITCAIGTTNVFEKAGINDVKLKTCYCCDPASNAEVKKSLIEFEAPSKEILEEALKKINFPVKSIDEVTKTEPAKN